VLFRDQPVSGGAPAVGFGDPPGVKRLQCPTDLAVEPGLLGQQLLGADQQRALVEVVHVVFGEQVEGVSQIGHRSPLPTIRTYV
jgi:hypothetical protein